MNVRQLHMSVQLLNPTEPDPTNLQHSLAISVNPDPSSCHDRSYPNCIMNPWIPEIPNEVTNEYSYVKSPMMNE